VLLRHGQCAQDAVAGDFPAVRNRTTAASLVGGVLWLFETAPGAPAKTPASGSTTALQVPAVLDGALPCFPPGQRHGPHRRFRRGKMRHINAIESSGLYCDSRRYAGFPHPDRAQYRPALERFTCELPAGMVRSRRSSAETCARELREETGRSPAGLMRFGAHARIPRGWEYHSLVSGGNREAEMIAASEPGIEVELVSFERLRTLILTGEFDLQFHVAVVGLALISPSSRGCSRHPHQCNALD